MVAGWWVWGFFHDPNKMFKGDRKPEVQQVAAANTPVAVGRTFKPGEPVPAPGDTAAAVRAPAPPKPDPKDALTPEQRYVVELADKGRLRLAAIAQVGDETRAWLEWVDTGNNPMAELDLTQLRDLGMEVEVASYGVRLKAGDIVQVATAWPRQPNVRETEARTYNTSEAGLGAEGGAGARFGAQSPARSNSPYAGSVVEKRRREQGTFPESPSYKVDSYTPSTTLDL